MTKIFKTAPELERLILVAISRHAACAAVTGVTVQHVSDCNLTNWNLADICGNGEVPPACRELCRAAIIELREQYDLLQDWEMDADF
jgi:hypothetical protein